MAVVCWRVAPLPRVRCGHHSADANVSPFFYMLDVGSPLSNAPLFALVPYAQVTCCLLCVVCVPCCSVPLPLQLAAASKVLLGSVPAHPRTRNGFFCNNFFAGTSTDKKSWNSHQPRLGIAPLARFYGPIARFGANSLAGPLPLGR